MESFSFERQDEEAGIGQGSGSEAGCCGSGRGNSFVSVYADGEGQKWDRPFSAWDGQLLTLSS